MDFGRFNSTCGLILAASAVSVLFVGCAESDGYVDYTSLPKTAVEAAALHSSVTEPPTATPETVAQDSGADKSVAEAQPASVTEADIADVKPVKAVYGAGDQGGDEPGAPEEIKLLIKHKTFQTVKGGDAIRVGYDDIDLEKILNIVRCPDNIVDHFPDWLKALDGKKVRMRGFMYPSFKDKGLKGFVFTRDTGVCCFGPDPYIFLRAEVKLADGERTDYIHMRPFDIEGTFRIDPLGDEGELLQLYRIEDAKVL